MFDIGLTEIIVVIIVGCVILDFKDIPAIIKWIRQVANYANNFINEVKQIFIDIDTETKIVTKKIIDLDGNEQIAYDLDDITPDILPQRNDKKHDQA